MGVLLYLQKSIINKGVTVILLMTDTMVLIAAITILTQIIIYTTEVILVITDLLMTPTAEISFTITTTL